MKYQLTLNGRTYEVEVELAEPMPMQQFQAYAPAPAAAVAEVAVSEAPVAAPTVQGEGKCVESPMPGTILKVNVTAGQTVKEGDVLVILEAMKMENEIMAPQGGTVNQVLVSKGSAVETGTPMVFIS